MNRRIMNIVNFVRGYDPEGKDIFYPLKRQVEVNKQYGIKNTFLLQYDAMLRDDFNQLFLTERNENMELGVWFENCRQLIERVGLEWKGRWDWDWHVNVGFLPGYELPYREKIIDEVFRLFKEIYGEYPQVVGSWLMDSYSMNYMCEKYNIKAFCICREQYAVDAYTLWGGYSNGGYYPCKNNMLCPAQTEEAQMNAPVFRMLGPDPIYNYDGEKYYRGEKRYVWTMEPAWHCGREPETMDWYFDTYYKTPCLAFAESTTGQENPFGWNVFGEGYIMQIEKLVKLQEEGVLVLEKLGDTGEAFKKAYKVTPPQAQVALTDWNGNGIKTVWYNSKNYKANIFLKDGQLFFRDINKYDEKYVERYIDKRCESWLATYDALPIIDSRLWSSEKEECGLFIKGEVANIEVVEESETDLRIDIFYQNGGKGKILFTENGIQCRNMCLDFVFGSPEDTEISIKGDKIMGKHNGFEYEMKLIKEKDVTIISI